MAWPGKGRPHAFLARAGGLSFRHLPGEPDVASASYALASYTIASAAGHVFIAEQGSFMVIRVDEHAIATNKRLKLDGNAFPVGVRRTPDGRIAAVHTASRCSLIVERAGDLDRFIEARIAFTSDRQPPGGGDHALS